MAVVVCASEGYPSTPRTGDAIEGIEEAQAIDGVSVYAAGVKADEEGALITGGGRVLNVVGRGDTIEAAIEAAYAGVGKISWPGMHYRSDIARQAI